jgi:hypothetical protein
MALRQYGERVPLGAAHAKMLEDQIAQQERAGSISTSICTTTDDLIRHAHLPGATGSMRGSITAVDTPPYGTASNGGFTDPTTSYTSLGPNLASTASTSTSFSGDLLVSDLSGKGGPSPAFMSALFTYDRGVNFNLDDFLLPDKAGQTPGSAMGTDGFDISNFSFDPQQVSELFGSAT